MSRVVLFDANPTYRESIREVLEREGHSVAVEDDLARVVAAHHKASVDVLICGIRTEAELDVLKAARSRLGAILALPSTGLEAGARAAGIAVVLRRPFGRAALSDAIAKAKCHGDVARARETARLGFGEIVVGHIESRLGVDVTSGEAGDELVDVLHRASEAFPHTSIAELVDAMMDGLIGGR